LNQIEQLQTRVEQQENTIQQLQASIEQFKKMGGRYIFSAVPIENAAENNLFLEKVFDSKESAWNIYLYKAM
jgi:cell division septum initiation protein DivIVA